MNRRLKIKLAVLRLVIANDDGGYMSREDDVHNDLITFLRPMPSTAEVKDIFTECDRDGLVVGVMDEGVMRWSPTPKGRAWKLKQEQC